VKNFRNKSRNCTQELPAKAREEGFRPYSQPYSQVLCRLHCIIVTESEQENDEDHSSSDGEDKQSKDQCKNTELQLQLMVHRTVASHGSRTSVWNRRMLARYVKAQQHEETVELFQQMQQ
jgi:hypothetical protein